MRWSSVPKRTPPAAVVGALARSVAGPLLIVGGVLVILHDFAFGGMVTTQYRDILQFWLPTQCLLGRTIAGGELPLWNPLLLGGHPFAADPQSGWTSLPVMALYSALPCDTAITLLIPLQPILAGLGLYWFLRGEGASRVSATVGGLAISLGASASRDILALPYTSALAWTTIALALASRYFRARTWSGRLAWGTGCALAWGQIAAAHLSTGFVLGSLALAVYAVARSVSDLRSRTRRPVEALASLAALGLILLPVNAAVLLPRLAYLDRTSISLGYSAIEAINARLWDGRLGTLLPQPASPLAWPLRWGTSPGTYLGAIPLAMAFAGWFRSGRRYLLLAFSAFGLAFYVLTLEPVVRTLTPIVRGSLLGDLYLRGPNRLQFGVLLATAVASAVGLDAFLREPRAARRLVMVVPGVAVWGVLWLPFDIQPSVMLLPALGAAAGTLALVGATLDRRLAFLVAALLAVELAASGLSGFRYGPADRPGSRVRGSPEGEDILLQPDVRASDALVAPALVRGMRGNDLGRFAWLSASPSSAASGSRSESSIPPGMQRHLTTLFGVEDAQGYNPTQPLRYWRFVRTVSPTPMPYNRSYFQRMPPAVAVELLDIEWVMSPPDEISGRWSAVASGSGRNLYRRPPLPRASVYASWSVAGTAKEALEAVTGDFDAARDLVVEGWEPPPPGAPANAAVEAEFRWTGSSSAEIEVDSPRGGILLVRNVYDENWRAEVDGRTAPVVPADYLLQGIPVPPGRHVVVLRYEDRLVTLGLAVSATAIALLLAAAAVLWFLRRRRARESAPAAAGPATPPSVRP